MTVQCVFIKAAATSTDDSSASAWVESGRSVCDTSPARTRDGKDVVANPATVRAAMDLERSSDTQLSRSELACIKRLFIGDG